MPRSSPLADVLSKNLIFVTGKGGVGKTTIAISLALLAARAGKSTLLCEAEPKGEVAQYFGRSSLGFTPTEVRPNLSAMEMNTEAALQEYLRIFLKIPFPTRLGPLAKTFDFVANAAPGVKEILVVGKLCFEVRAGRFDIIIVDAPAAGQVVSQLGAPRGVGDLIPVGMVKDQTAWMSEILGDPARSGVCLVTTAEETPVEEAVELAGSIARESDVAITLGVMNKVVPAIFSPREEALAKLVSTGAGLETLATTFGPGAYDLVSATNLWGALVGNHQRHGETFWASLGPDVHAIEVPAILGPNLGDTIITEVADTIEVELS